MKERPILFNAEMVRAILAGRKTQTRRPCRWQEFRMEAGLYHPDPSKALLVATDSRDGHPVIVGDASDPRKGPLRIDRCPFGQPGHHLWVRETFGTTKGNGIRTVYRADYKADDSDEPRGGWIRDKDGERFIHGLMTWRPSIHMPRSASRITLEVTGVRVERVQDISDWDCADEGVEPCNHDQVHTDQYRCSFYDLWQSIYADKGIGFEANPWVWVVDFKRVTP